jgi:hypothetical protein
MDERKVQDNKYSNEKDARIDKNIHGRERAKTELHEIVEKHYMDKGLPYWKAHKKAIKAEQQIR